MISVPHGFLWGAATSAYQVEGAVAEDGRGPSIWDTFSHTPGTTRGEDTGDVACDQYHRFGEDVALMAELGIQAYRFSVAWPRIQPTGLGPADARGLDHYRRLVSALREAGIAPVPTLFHWDLPQPLEDEGGWPNRDTAYRFAEYARLVFEALRDEAELWITINEPWVAAWFGYGTGVHAPGRTDDALALAAAHHLLLAHGLAQEAMGEAAAIALNLEPHRPATDDPVDASASELADLHMNAFFLDPLFGRGYPARLVEHYQQDVTDWGFVRDGDLDTIARPLPFLGVNFYRPQTIAATARVGAGSALPGGLGAAAIVPEGVPTTANGWPIDPSGLSEILERVHREYGPSRIVVTENGAAFDDVAAEDGRIRDEDRIAYLDAHVRAADEALRTGVPLAGYFVWSLLDNFEWAEGYSTRFGLVHVDRNTQDRIPKASAEWYRDLIRATRRDALP